MKMRLFQRWLKPDWELEVRLTRRELRALLALQDEESCRFTSDIVPRTPPGGEGETRSHPSGAEGSRGAFAVGI